MVCGIMWLRPGIMRTLTGSVFVDGVEKTGVYAAGTDYTSTGRHQFGKGRNNASEYVGYADELAIWNTTLTPSQIQA